MGESKGPSTSLSCIPITCDAASLRTKIQVPALASPNLDQPLTESLDISYWLCSFSPGLLPGEYEVTIRTLLSKLGDPQAESLSVTNKEDRSEGLPCPTVDALLAKEDIGFHYRQALEYKRDLYLCRFLTLRQRFTESSNGMPILKQLQEAFGTRVGR